MEKEESKETALESGSSDDETDDKNKGGSGDNVPLDLMDFTCVMCG